MLRWELNGGFEAMEGLGSRAETALRIDVKVRFLHTKLRRRRNRES